MRAGSSAPASGALPTQPPPAPKGLGSPQGGLGGGSAQKRDPGIPAGRHPASRKAQPLLPPARVNRDGQGSQDPSPDPQPTLCGALRMLQDHLAASGPLGAPHPSLRRLCRVGGSAPPPEPSPLWEDSQSPQQARPGCRGGGVPRGLRVQLPLGTPGASGGGGIRWWAQLGATSLPVGRRPGQGKGAGHKAASHLPPRPSPSPAAAEEEQVLHGRDGGAGVLASDQVAVQHHVHGVGLAGCRRPPGAQASGRVLGRLPRRSRTCPPGPGTRGQGLAPQVLGTLSPSRRAWPGPPLTTEAGPRVLHEVLHDQGQVGEAGRPDELVHGRLRGKGTQAQGATPATWGLLRVEGPAAGAGAEALPPWGGLR